MKSIARWLAIATAAGSLGWVGTVHAKASASATFGPLRVTLFDLNPMDGIAPAITFGSGGTNVGVGVYDSDNSVFRSEYVETSVAFDSMAVSAFAPLGAAAAAFNGVGTAAGSGIATSGWSAGTGYALNTFSSNATTFTIFTLTPWTAISFDTDATVVATTTIGTDGIGWETAETRLDFVVWAEGPGGTETHQATRKTWADVGVVCDPVTGDCVYTGISRTVAGAFGLSYANASALDSVASFSATATIYGQSLLPVPEPEVYLLMLAGLGVVGLTARRRRSD